MSNSDVDDIFKDYEYKVTGKKPIGEGSIKKKYEEEQKAMKEEFDRETKELNAKNPKPEGKKIPFSERFFYIGVILIMGAFIVTNLSLFHGNDENKQEIVANVVANTSESTEVMEEVAALQTAVANETTNETESTEELSGVIELSIDKIYTSFNEDVDELGYIEKVIFTITNGKDEVLMPVVNVYAYDDELEDSWKMESRGTYTYEAGISPGKQKTGTIHLSPKTFRNLNLEKFVRVELNSTEEGFVAAKTETITMS